MVRGRVRDTNSKWLLVQCSFYHVIHSSNEIQNLMFFCYQQDNIDTVFYHIYLTFWIWFHHAQSTKSKSSLALPQPHRPPLLCAYIPYILLSFSPTVNFYVLYLFSLKNVKLIYCKWYVFASQSSMTTSPYSQLFLINWLIFKFMYKCLLSTVSDTILASGWRSEHNKWTPLSSWSFPSWCCGWWCDKGTSNSLCDRPEEGHKNVFRHDQRKFYGKSRLSGF